MRARRLASAVLLAGPLGLAVLLGGADPALAEDPVDTTPPVGTLTVNGGATATNSLVLSLDVTATDDVAVTAVQVVLDGTSLGDWVTYASAITAAMPDGTPDGLHAVAVTWADAMDNRTTSETIQVELDRQAPVIGTPTFGSDPEPADALQPVMVAGDGWPIESLRFSVNGTTWGAPIPYLAVVNYPYLDPVYGGSSRLGLRRVYVRAIDAAGNASAPTSRIFSATVQAPIKVSPDVPRTGHRITLAPQYPAPISWPSGTHCYWEVLWGNDQSLYYGNRDDTYGFFHTYGPASKGFCDARSFTLPWMPYPQVLVSFRAEAPGADAVVDESIGASPEEAAIVPVIDSTSRHITYSNVPMVYVLPEDYTLILGVPTTYRAYSVAGAPIGARDMWFAAYTDTPEQKMGGTSFTFTPRYTGFITVCWNSDTTKATRYSACYDPPVRRRDSTRPNTTPPVARLGTGTLGATVPVVMTWDGSDVGWGIARFQLERSVDGGAWKRLLSARVKTLAQSVTPGHSYRYRVRAVDKAGHAGYWDYGPTFRPRIHGDGSSAATYSAAWTMVPDETARGGSLRESAKAGSVARFTFTGRDVAWIAERGPGHGRAKVYVDGTLAATVDLAAATDAPGRIVFRKHWPTTGSHVVRIVVEGTAARPIVGVDGFVVLR